LKSSLFFLSFYRYNAAAKPAFLPPIIATNPHGRLVKFLAAEGASEQIDTNKGRLHQTPIKMLPACLASGS
jgi:hypothetical protein